MARQRLQEQLTLLDDRAAAGRAAAAERAKVRDELLVQMTQFITDLEEASDAAAAALREAHEAKAQRKTATLQRSLELCDEKEQALDDHEFMDAEDERTLESEREAEAQRLVAQEQQSINSKLQNQLKLFKDEATKQVQLEAAACANAEARAAEASAAVTAANDQVRLQQQQLQQQQQAAAALAATAAQQQQQQQAEATATAAETAPTSQAPEWWAEFLKEEARVATTGPSIADLPATYPQPQKECLQALDVAWRVLETVQLQHDRVLTFTEIGLSTTQCAELLGGVWAKMYSNHPIPAVMPRILASYLFRALQQLAATFAGRPEEERTLADKAAKLVLESPDVKRVRLAHC